MGLVKLVERLYPKVFVGMLPSASGIKVVVELSQNGAVTERASRSYDTPEDVAKFLAPYLAESPFHYVGLLNATEEQGALPVGTPKEAETFIDTATSITLCRNDAWLLYASKPALDVLQKRYRSVGVDYIFSPFSILERFFADKISESTALFALVEEEVLSSAVFSEGKLLFARRLSGDQEQITLDESMEGEAVSLSFELDTDGIEEGLELDDINAIDDLEGLDDLNEIEDLDTIDDLEQFEEHEPVTAPAAEHETVTEFSPEGFNREYLWFQMLQTTLQAYYNDPKYDNRFVETIYIADGCGLGGELKHYLEEELFMKVFIRKIDIAAEVADLAKAEVNDAS